MSHTANSKTTTKVQKRAQHTQNDLAHDRRRMQQHARELADDVRETVAETREHATRIAQVGYELARDTTAEYLARGRQRARELEQGVEAYVTQRPLRSILIAAGMGFFAGIFLMRR